MRKCAIHGTEINCAAFVAGGFCNGIIHGTDNEPPAPAPDANARLDKAAEVLNMDLDEASSRYDEDLARLKMAGLSEENARIMLDAPGSPWYGFSDYRAHVIGARNAEAANAAEDARIAAAKDADAEVTPEQPLPAWPNRIVNVETK